MTDARDESGSGKAPGPAPPVEPVEPVEPPGPGPVDGPTGSSGTEKTPEPVVGKRRRSGSRGRPRRSSEAEPTSGSTTPDGAAERDGAGNDAAGESQGNEGESRGSKVVRGAKRPAPASYGPLEAAFFDLDKTVIAKASMVAFGRPFYNGGLINRRTVLRALYGELIYLHLGASEQKLNRIRESVLRLIKGWHRDRVREIVAEAIEEIIEPIIFAEAADLIDWHHDQGRLVVIVSASPEEIVTPLSRFLGADDCIASRARVDDEGRYTGTMQFYAFGSFKAEAMDVLAAQRGIDLAASYAYTDSYTDLPMLEAVGHPVAVNPDRVLNRYARRARVRGPPLQPDRQPLEPGS